MVNQGEAPPQLDSNNKEKSQYLEGAKNVQPVSGQMNGLPLRREKSDTSSNSLAKSSGHKSLPMSQSSRAVCLGFQAEDQELEADNNRNVSKRRKKQSKKSGGGKNQKKDHSQGNHASSLHSGADGLSEDIEEELDESDEQGKELSYQNPEKSEEMHPQQQQQQQTGGNSEARMKNRNDQINFEKTKSKISHNGVFSDDSLPKQNFGIKFVPPIKKKIFDTTQVDRRDAEHAGATDSKNLKLMPDTEGAFAVTHRTQSKLDEDMKNMQSQPIFEVQNVHHDDQHPSKNRRRAPNHPPEDVDDDEQLEEEEEEEEEAEAEEDGEEAMEEEEQEQEEDQSVFKDNNTTDNQGAADQSFPENDQDQKRQKRAYNKQKNEVSGISYILFKQPFHISIISY